MYSAVKIYVYMRDKKTLITTITPDSTGNFSIALAKGTYYVDMTHPPIGGITGVPKTLDILEGKTVTLLIKVDTGIR